MKRTGIRLAVVVALLMATRPDAVAAQDRNQVRATAKSSAERLRGLGEPMDRCAFGATIEGRTVTDLLYPGPLRVGDQFRTFNGTDVSTASNEQQIIGLARAIGPGTVIRITVERDGALVDVEVTCANARVYMGPTLAALDFAARGKFDDCAKTLDLAGQQDLSTLFLRLQCAANSRKYNTLVGELTFSIATKSVALARVVPARRPATIELLRASEAVITQARGSNSFQALVSETRRWPGGETLWDRSEPNWSLFRTNGEAALIGRLIDPESARIEWTRGFVLGSWKPMFAPRIDGYWTCGRINARNRMGGYTGSTAFVVVLGREGSVRYVEIGTADDVDFLTVQCQNSAHLLPPPNAAFATATVENGSPVSVADEIQKLLALKESGAITQEEFDAAKAKLLGLPR